MSKRRPTTCETGGPPWLLLSVLVLLLVVLWLFTTTGGSQVFVKDLLGEAYDSQAEHFLRGDVDVDGEAIRHEAMIVNGRARMYFGPFPALLRIPLNFVHPEGRGRWSRISVFCAATVALCSFVALVRAALAKSVLTPAASERFGIVCLVAFALASPLLLLLGEASIYNEAIVWGLAGSLTALLFAFRVRDLSGAGLMANLVGFSLAAGIALLSRITFGLPLLIVAALLAVRLRPPALARNLVVLLLPIGTAAVFYVLLSYARFGSVTGVNYDYYINPTHREFVRKEGIFRLNRVPYALGDYFAWRPPSFQTQVPFFRAERHPYGLNGRSELTSLPVSETYLSIPWCSGWLFAGAIVGSILFFRAGGADMFEQVIAAALLLECLIVLAYFAIAQRYAADFYPFLLVGFVVFVSRGSIMFPRMRGAIIALAVLSICVNTLTTISWLTERDQNVPAQTRDAWNHLLRR